MKVQSLLLDSLAPLTSILEAHHKGVTLDHKEVIQAVKSGMHLIGNANDHLLHLRRERIVSELNKALLPIVGDDNNFKEAAPFLFGTELAKKSKVMVEQVKVMRSTISKKQEWVAPPPIGGASTDDSEGAEPRPSNTGTGHVAESQKQAKRHAEAVVYLLQCLGFKINLC